MTILLGHSLPGHLLGSAVHKDDVDDVVAYVTFPLNLHCNTRREKFPKQS